MITYRSNHHRTLWTKFDVRSIFERIEILNSIDEKSKREITHIHFDRVDSWVLVWRIEHIVIVCSMDSNQSWLLSNLRVFSIHTNNISIDLNEILLEIYESDKHWKIHCRENMYRREVIVWNHQSTWENNCLLEFDNRFRSMAETIQQNLANQLSKISLPIGRVTFPLDVVALVDSFHRERRMYTLWNIYLLLKSRRSCCCDYLSTEKKTPSLE